MQNEILLHYKGTDNVDSDGRPYKIDLAEQQNPFLDLLLNVEKY